MTRQRILRTLGLGVFVCAALGAALYLLSLVGTNVIPKDRYKIRAVVPTSVALAQYADVRQAGVNIGDVSKLEAKGEGTVLTLEIERKHTPVYRDATVLIRAKSIAEENYVELDPGTPEAGKLPENGLLSIEHAQEATQHDDVFSIFDEHRRRDLQRALGGLGPGLADGGGKGLNRTFESTRALTSDAAPLAQIFAEQRNEVADLVDSFGRVASALGSRADAIRVFTRRAKVTADAVAARDDALRATLDELPPFLAQSRATADRLRDFSVNATAVMRDLRLATEELVPTVRDLRPAAVAGQRTVRELERFSRVALPAFDQLEPFARAARGFVPPFEGFLRQLNPLIRYLEPYWRETTNWFALAGAATYNRDQVSHVARVLLPISRSNFPAVVPPEQEEFVDRLTGGLDTRGVNPYPNPGTAGGGTPFDGNYPRLRRDPPYSRGR